MFVTRVVARQLGAVGGFAKVPVRFVGQTSSKSVAEKQRKAIVEASGHFGEALGVGGFSDELEGVLRRVLMSRMVPRETRDRLGLRHARGLLLHGPPGTGKTMIARGLAKVLGDRKPTIVDGPEVFSHLLGASEQAVRGLFKPADDEWKRMGSQSSLHVIVFDEVDSVLRKRGGGESGDGSFGGAARDGVVNQLLAKMDGMSEQSNILVIGTTNRLDLMDPAALRPGRLDVQVEIALPDADGRYEILALHAKKLADSGALDADGLEDVLRVVANTKTQNFSGSELEAAVRNASSYALARALKTDGDDVADGDADPAQVLVTSEDLLRGADDIVPLFGKSRATSTTSLGRVDRSGDAAYDEAVALCADAADSVQRSDAASNVADRRRSAALVGPAGAGKRTMAASVLENAPKVAFQRTVDASFWVGRDLNAARKALVELFADARRSPSAAVVLHDFELLPRDLLPLLKALLREGHGDPHRLLTLATVNDDDLDAEGLDDLLSAFDASARVPRLPR